MQYYFVNIIIVVSQLKHLKSKTTSLFFGALYVIYQLSEIKDDIQVVPQFPCLMGHPVYFLNVFKH